MEAVQHDAHHHDDHHHEMTFLEKYIFPTDHKYIGMQYLLTGMAMALFGGFFVYAFRMQLAFPGMDVPFFGQVSPLRFNSPSLAPETGTGASPKTGLSVCG